MQHEQNYRCHISLSTGKTKLAGRKRKTNLSWIAAIWRQSIVGLPILIGCCPKPDHGRPRFTKIIIIKASVIPDLRCAGFTKNNIVNLHTGDATRWTNKSSLDRRTIYILRVLPKSKFIYGLVPQCTYLPMKGSLWCSLLPFLRLRNRIGINEGEKPM